MNSFYLDLKAGGYWHKVKFTQIKDQFYLTFNYNKKLIEEIKSMSGAKWHKGTKQWSIDISRRNRRALDLLTDKQYIKRYDKPLLSIVPNNFGALAPHWGHQVSMFQAMVTRKAVIIAGEMRTGKTRPTIDLINYIEPKTVWFVSTKSALRGIPTQLKKWDCHQDVELMTYNKFTKQAYSGIIPQMLIFDEFHKLKSTDSARGKAALYLTELMEEKHGYDDTYIIGLSGTPAPKNPTDWWPLCEIVYPGFLREGDPKKFKYRYGIFEDSGEVGNNFKEFKAWNDTEVGQLYKRMQGLVYTYLKKDCMDLPEIQYEEVQLPILPKARIYAKKLLADAANAAVARSLLSQLSDGFVYEKSYNEKTNEYKRSGYTFIGSPKLEALENDLDEYEDTGRVVIYTGYTASTDLVAKKCVEKGWKVLKVSESKWTALNTQHTVEELYDQLDRSNEQTIEKIAFVAQMDGACEGHEFTASPIIIFYSNSDQGANRQQAEARAHSDSMDKERGLIIRDYLHLEVDKLKLTSLREKKRLQDLSLGVLKAALNG